MRTIRNEGFTLVELSIVLSIIALVAGGIFAGTAVMHAMELKKVNVEASEYKTAIKAFQERYSAYPGDLSTATQYWGVAHAVPATCQTTAADHQNLTCNGNGDGMIAPTSATQLFYAGTEDYEMFRLWQHLFNAGLTEDRVTGIRTAGGTRYVTVGTNVPRSSGFKDAGWTIFTVRPWAAGVASNCSGGTTNNRQFAYCYLGSSVSLGSTFAGHGSISNQPTSNTMRTVFGNVMLYGKNVTNELNSDSVMHPDDALSIDTKFDDGAPDYGNIIAVANVGVNACFIISSTGQALYNSSYVSTAAIKGCGLMFTQAF